MSVADEETTINGYDYDSETASLDEEEKNVIADSISNHLRTVVSLRSEKFELPETVSLLECKNGTKVYLVGTAHFSKESVEDVVKVMSKTHPDYAVVELCRSRLHVLTMCEEKIKQEIKQINILQSIKVNGLGQGVMQYLLLRLNAYLVKTLGMAPGGEFRAAAQEAMKQPHCHVILGDRPVGTTLQRAFNALGPWTKLRLAFTLMFDFEPITKEQIEEMKKTDLLEKMLMEMAGDHPELIRILVDERDMYLARSIWATTGMADYNEAVNSSLADNDQTEPAAEEVDPCKLQTPLGDRVPQFSSVLPSSAAAQSALPSTNSRLLPSCCPYWPSPSLLPRVIVAVVGIGHVAGIKRYWDTAEQIDQQKLVQLMEPPLSWKIFKWSLRTLVISLLVGIGYGTIRSSYKLGSFLIRSFR
ncbi:unnamed protein product [Calicophoron daubneyi]|uniref:TraB domain-containing protein n=1 Tax=Calicophoron daubneyi TaxID=300641 RepID=A0AAV2TK86_CALDB